MLLDFNSNRDASATIAGFVYQVHTTVLRWLDLHEGEELHLEAGEDIDTVRASLEAGTYQETRTLEQIKRRREPITLRSPSALKRWQISVAIEIATQASNYGFRYVTTAFATVERDRRTAVVDDADWEALHQRASTLVPRQETMAEGIIYMIGAALHAPIKESFGLQVWLVRHVEICFRDLPSIQSKIFYPFLEGYRLKAINTQAHSFRTAHAYTRKAVLDCRSEGDPRLWARLLLRRMAFCLYASTSPQIAGWLESDELNYPLQQG